MAFYHKYRPQQFRDLVGQDHIKQTLQNALAQGQVSHAYLLAGPKGSGKTTTARLLARAVNCSDINSQLAKTQVKQSEPCNQCQVCQEIIAGQSLDIVEIDAASNRGIDEIRNLRDRLVYRPVNALKKVYIIDEVHMLTREAFNALLKTLEEPPDHILFIFATTEPNRVPDTILSRVQRFDFRRAQADEIVDWLKMIVVQEGLAIDQDALKIIADKSNGAFRDAAVLLEQVAARGVSPITKAMIYETIGLADEQSIIHLTELILAGQAQAAIGQVDSLFSQGVDMTELIDQMIGYSRRLIRSTFDQPILLLLNQLLQARNQLRYSPIAQLPIELSIIEVTKNLPARPVRQTSPKVDPPGQADLAKWPAIIKALEGYNHSLVGILKDAQVIRIEGSAIHLGVRFKFHCDRILESKNRSAIEQHASEIIGQPVTVHCVVLKDQPKKSTEATDELAVAQAAEEMFG